MKDSSSQLGPLQMFATGVCMQAEGLSSSRALLATRCVSGSQTARQPGLTHCMWDSCICVLLPPRIALITHYFRRKLWIFPYIVVYSPYAINLRTVVSSHASNHALRKNRLASLGNLSTWPDLSTPNSLTILAKVIESCIQNWLST